MSEAVATKDYKVFAAHVEDYMRRTGVKLDVISYDHSGTEPTMWVRLTQEEYEILKMDAIWAYEEAERLAREARLFHRTLMNYGPVSA